MQQIITRVMALAKKYQPGTFASINAKALLAIQAQITRVPSGTEELTSNRFIFELFFGSINYAYFYGTPKVYPANGSTHLRDHLSYLLATTPSPDLTSIGWQIKTYLSLQGFPMLSQRCTHIDEITENPAAVEQLFHLAKDNDLVKFLPALLINFPGYASDLFLKRAFLLVQTLHREYGCFSRHAISKIPLPADYQVPKVMKHYNILQYSPDLANRIAKLEPIQAHSLMEIEIRSASILAAHMLSGKDISPMDVDVWFWSQRKTVANAPYHLTQTTDY